MPDPVTGGVAAGGSLLNLVGQSQALGAQEDALKDYQGLTQEGLAEQQALYGQLADFYKQLLPYQMGIPQGYYQDYRANVNPYIMGGGAAYNQVLGQLGLPMQGIPMYQAPSQPVANLSGVQNVPAMINNPNITRSAAIMRG